MVSINYERNAEGESVNVQSDEQETNDVLLKNLFGADGRPPKIERIIVDDSEILNITADQLRRFTSACAGKKKIGAIKELRAIFGWGLKEAKFFMDGVDSI